MVEGRRPYVRHKGIMERRTEPRLGKGLVIRRSDFAYMEVADRKFIPQSAITIYNLNKRLESVSAYTGFDFEVAEVMHKGIPGFNIWRVK